MPKQQTKKSDCKNCYGKGYFSVATGGSIAKGDFIGDADYKVPLKIEHRPCLKCKPKESSRQKIDNAKNIKELFEWGFDNQV